LGTSDERAIARSRAPQPAPEPPGSFFSARVDLPILGGLFLLAAAYAWMRVSMNGTYFRGDILTQFMPYYTMVADRVKSGDLPGWNPAIFSGMPLAGDPISGWTYLPVMIPFILFNTLTAYKTSVLIHLSLATLATYLLGRSLRMGPIGAAAAAIAYLLSPFYHYSQCCTARMQLGPWIPIGLLLIELSLRARSWWLRLALWFASGFAIWQIIAGYFGKGMYYGVLLLGAYLAYRTLIDPPLPVSDWRARIARFVLAAGTVLASGAAFSAIVLLPRLDFLDHANLKGGSYEVIAPGAVDPPAWSLGRALSTVLDPSRPTYVLGGATVALAAVGVVLATRRFAVPFFAVFSVAVITLTMDTTPFHRLMYLLPKFEDIHIHEPQRILVVLNIGPAMLVGAAVAAIEQRSANLRRVALAAATPLILTGLIELATRRDHRELNSELLQASVLVGGVLIASVLLAIYGTRRLGERLPLALAIGLTLFLLFNLDRGRLREATADGWDGQPVYDLGLAYADQHDEGGAGAFLREQQRLQGPFRYFGYNTAYLSAADDYMEDNYRKEWRDPLAARLLVNNRALALGLEDIQGYNPVQEMVYLQFINTLNGQIQEYHETNILPAGLNSPLLKLLNVRYIVIPLAPPDTADYRFLTSSYPEVFRDGEVRVLEVTNALPRAWSVHNVQTVTEDQMLATLADSSIDLTTTALVNAPGLTVAPLPAGGSDQVAVTHYEPDRITLSATMASDGMVVLSEVYDPGWSATIDGKSVSIYQVNGVLRGIPVSAGEHTIRLEYKPRSLTIGTAITLASLVLAAAIVAAFRVFPGIGRSRPLRWIDRVAYRSPNVSG
jgi:hypothetical protein